MIQASDFQPPPSLSNAHLQSILASSKVRRERLRRRKPGMAAASQRLTLDCGGGVRLYGFHSPQPDRADTSAKLVVLIHGWEGCRESVYLFSMATALWEAGFDVLRLDLRDHGDSYHLNQAPFHSARLSDPLGALADIAKRLPGGDCPGLIGFSLGGNFALRLARAAPDHGLELAHVLAVSPSIHPKNTIHAIDSGAWFYPWYFRRKWQRSLAAKERAFEGRYDFSHYRKARSFDEATALFAPEHAGFDNYLDYLDAYTVTSARMTGLQTPVTVITAADDPVVPVADFDNFVLPGDNRILITDHGGHCGFVENWQMDCFTERLATEVFS